MTVFFRILILISVLMVTLSCTQTPLSSTKYFPVAIITTYPKDTGKPIKIIHTSIKDAFSEILLHASSLKNDSHFTLELQNEFIEEQLSLMYDGSTTLNLLIKGTENSAIINANNLSSVLTFSGKDLVVTLGNNLVIKNGLSSEGGGVNVFESTLILDGSSITNNKAYFAGGGIYIKNGTLQIKNGIVSHNSAIGMDNSSIGAEDNFIGHGGGVYLTGTRTTEKINNLFEIINTETYFTFTGGLVTANHATGLYGGGSGGGIYLNYNTVARMSANARVEGNTSDYFAGICFHGTSFNNQGGSIKNNNSLYTEEHNIISN